MGLLSRNVHVNVPAPKAVSSLYAIDRWSDCIGHLVGDSRHLGTLSTILQFTLARTDLLCMKNAGTQWTIEISSNE